MNDLETRLLPNALDAECALLGCVLIDRDAWFVARTLKPEDFYREANALIFNAMYQLDDVGLALDVITVTTRLERTGQLEKVGGAEYVYGLVNYVPTAQNVHYYADLVKKAAEGRKVIQFAGNLAAIGYHSSDPASAAARAVETLAGVQGDAALDLTPEEARQRLENLQPTLQRLDVLTAREFPQTVWVVPDLLPEGLTLLAAKPKLGKSWLALGLGLAVASGGVALGRVQVEQGDVLYLALEDSPKRIHQRSKQVLRGQPAPGRMEVDTCWPRLDEGGLRLLEVWLLAHPDARLIILDTLAKIRGQARSATLYGDDYASLEDVQRLAHRRGVAILVIHHTGKESREDPLDEVNATQGLNGVADNILVLRRERGKAQATLIGDGRELNGSEMSLRFDGATGAWTQVESPPADQPKTPERAEILDLLKASGEPMSPRQIAEALGRNVSTIRTLLTRMAHAGDIKTKTFGKYTTVDFVDFVDAGDASTTKKSKQEDADTLFDKQEHTSERRASTKSTKSTVMQKPEAEPEAAEDSQAILPVAPPTLAARRFASLRAGATNDSPPEEFLRFADMVARETHNRLDDASIQRVPEPAQQASLDDFLAMARPDAHDPYTLQPSGLRPAGLEQAAGRGVWPVKGDCTGVFCQGECVCGEHLCDPCGCEAGALIDNHPWYFERREARRGAICQYCFAPATLMSRWKTPLCERCWLIASRGQGIDPRRYQPRPFGPLETDNDGEEDGMAGD